MSCKINFGNAGALFRKLLELYDVFAPVIFKDDGAFSDTPVIRYKRLTAADEFENIAFEKRSDYSFKEALIPVCQNLFYFNEDKTQVSGADLQQEDDGIKERLIFLRSCDIHAVGRLDKIFLENGEPDFYYARVRGKIKFALLPCSDAGENCFCVQFGTNISGNYDYFFEKAGTESFYFEAKTKADLASALKESLAEDSNHKPSFITEKNIKGNDGGLTIPDIKTEESGAAMVNAPFWQEYDSRCINCGRCNFVCPTCTCWTMQDLFYTEDGRSGERRRVWASCMTDGYSTVAGGGEYRKKNGERMRFKVLHKIYDFKKRYGTAMCIGCGRCEDICPEYISYFNAINKLSTALGNYNGGKNG